MAIIINSFLFAPPQPQIAHLKFWGRADDLGLADGTAVSSFTDLSGHGNHATASTTARPTLKTGIINGHSVLRFDGSANLMNWPDLFGAATTGEMVVILKSFADPSGANQHQPWSLGNTGVGESAHPYTTGNIQEHFGSDTVTGLIEKPSAATTAHIFSVQTLANKMVCRWNGDIFMGLNKLTPGFISAPLLGGNATTNRWKGDIAEILLYDINLSTTDLKKIYDYATLRYSVSVSDVTTTFDPTSYSGLQAWYKADSLALSDTDPVSSWSDSSGNGRTLTGTTTTRPLYRTAIYNGLPTVRYDGTDDNLILGADLSLTGTLTCIMIGKSTTNNGSPFGNSTGVSQMRTRRAGSNVMNFFVGGGEGVSSATWNWGLGDLNMFVWTRSSGNVIHWFQGPQRNNTTDTEAGTFTERYLGVPSSSGLQFGGDICEACIYNTELTLAQLTQLYYTYFRDRWGLP